MLKKTIFYCLKFLIAYFLLYYGTYAVIGLSAKEGAYYSQFVHDYLDYPSWLRNGLLYSSDFLLDITGHDAHVTAPYKVGFIPGRSVQLVYSCLGIAVYSFWIAFIAANDGPLKKKLLFIITGAAIIFITNVIRIALLVIVANWKKGTYFEMNHHNFFNAVSYAIIFLMIYIFSRTDKKNDSATRSA